MTALPFLDKVRAGGREARVFRSGFVAGYLVFYALDAVLLGAFAVAGTIAFWIPVAFLAAGLGVCAVFSYLMLSGVADGCKDPYLIRWQMFASGAVMLAFLALAPQVGFLFLCILFIVFGFGSLRMSWREALASLGLVAAGTGLALYYTFDVPLLPQATALERLLVWIAFLLIFARLVSLGLVGSALRVRAVNAYRQLKVSLGALESRTAELLQARTAAEAAIQARLDAERKQAEAALLERERRFNALFEESLEANFLIAPDGRIVDANPEACRLFGRSADEFRALDTDAILDLADPKLAAALDEQQRTGRFRGELAMVRRDASRFDCEVSSTTFKDQNGLDQTHLIVRDITGRRRAERERERLVTRLELLAERLATVQEDERRGIGYTLEEQLGQELATLKVHLQVMEGRSGADQSDPHLQGALRIATRALERVQGLSHELARRRLDEAGLNAALRAHCAQQAAAAGLTIHIDAPAPEERPPLNVERACFRVMQEALANALRHARASGVWVSLQQSADELALCVRDNGTGFNVTALRRVEDYTKLGLLNMEQRAKHAGGRLLIQSAPGAGTEIRAVFPLRAAPG